MIKVVSKRKFKLENVEKAKELYLELIEETRKEEGCIAYELYQDIKDKSILTMIEEWESEKHLKAHSESEHFMRLVPQIGELGDGSSDLNIYKKIK